MILSSQSSHEPSPRKPEAARNEHGRRVLAGEPRYSSIRSNLIDGLPPKRKPGQPKTMGVHLN